MAPGVGLQVCDKSNYRNKQWRKPEQILKVSIITTILWNSGISYEDQELLVITDHHAVVNKPINSLHTARHGLISDWLQVSQAACLWKYSSKRLHMLIAGWNEVVTR